MVEDLAVEIRQRFTDHHRNHDKSNQEKRVDAGADDKRKDAVEIENECNGAIQHRNADLDKSIRKPFLDCLDLQCSRAPQGQAVEWHQR